MEREGGLCVTVPILCAPAHADLKLWVALAIMIAESIISLLPITISYAKRIVSHHRQRSSGSKVFQTSDSPRNSNLTEDDYYEPQREEDESDPEHEPPHRLVPLSWVQWGLFGSAVLGVMLVWYVFGSDGIHPWATAVGLVLASVLSLIGVRALGETDINPVSYPRHRFLEADCRCLGSAKSVNCYLPCFNRVTLLPTSLLAVSPRLALSSELSQPHLPRQ
jgi:hypothetical protein